MNKGGGFYGILSVIIGSSLIIALVYGALTKGNGKNFATVSGAATGAFESVGKTYSGG
jgi:uncharacterized protein YcfJ